MLKKDCEHAFTIKNDFTSEQLKHNGVNRVFKQASIGIGLPGTTILGGAGSSFPWFLIDSNNLGDNYCE